jgi:hypothetical protein
MLTSSLCIDPSQYLGSSDHRALIADRPAWSLFIVHFDSI